MKLKNLLINKSWKDIFSICDVKNLENFLKNSNNTLPEKQDIFRALNLVSYDQVKVVIIGQDPYHTKNVADGLAFSAKSEIRPSLKNIFKEIETDLNTSMPNKSDLTKWCNQGVLLLNRILTVEENTPMSHSNKGWEVITDYIITKLNNRQRPVIFLLWGKKAQELASLITNKHHYILTSAHPSPFHAIV